MAVPKRRRSSSRRDQRRLHIFLREPSLVPCAQCGQLKLSHTVCLNCGSYRGREVIDVLAKLDKKERKLKEKEIEKTKEEKKEAEVWQK
jgi:large subunit ribosomal protein L32